MKTAINFYRGSISGTQFDSLKKILDFGVFLNVLDSIEAIQKNLRMIILTLHWEHHLNLANGILRDRPIGLFSAKFAGIS